MDALHFSPEAKDTLVETLAAQMEEMNMKQRKHSGRKILLVGLAAAMLLVMLTGAAVFTRWARSTQAQYNPSQEVKEQAEKSGLSVMLENTANDPSHVLSATDQGITITAVQSIVDSYGAELTFRIEGFDLPEGRYPYIWPVITIDGTQQFFSYQGGSFFDGTTLNDAGEWVYVSNGQNVESDASGSVILDYVADDGSLEYTHHITFDEESGKYLGKEIVVSFSKIGVQSTQSAGSPEILVEGTWELRWTLTGTTEAISITPDAEIGDTGVRLLEAEIGQTTLRTVYQLESYWDGWETLETFSPQLCGVRMKDGTEYDCIPSSEGYQDQEKLIYFVESSMFHTILDLSQVESLIFCTDKDVPVYHYIPIQ